MAFFLLSERYTARRAGGRGQPHEYPGGTRVGCLLGSNPVHHSHSRPTPLYVRMPKHSFDVTAVVTNPLLVRSFLSLPISSPLRITNIRFFGHSEGVDVADPAKSLVQYLPAPQLTHYEGLFAKYLQSLPALERCVFFWSCMVLFWCSPQKTENRGLPRKMRNSHSVARCWTFSEIACPKNMRMKRFSGQATTNVVARFFFPLQLGQVFRSPPSFRVNTMRDT